VRRLTHLTLHDPRAVCQTALRWSRTSAAMLASDSGRPMPLGDLFEFLKRDPEQTIQIAPANLSAVVGNLRSIHC
jgi:hypothetical protein